MDALEGLLKKAGFINVTGYAEVKNDLPRRVGIAFPESRKTWFCNMNIFALIDEDGHTWVISGRALDEVLQITIVSDILGVYGKYYFSKKHSYVPFSNDGGAFAREFWPQFYQK